MANKTLQEDIDFQLSSAGGNIYSFALSGLSGECKVPSNVNIRFLTCTFNSFTNTFNNIFYFKDCTFKDEGDYTIIGASCIFDNCTFDSVVNLKACKVELIKCNINKDLNLISTSLESTRSTFKSEEGLNAIYAKEGSRVVSTLDFYDGWTETLWKAEEDCFIKVSKPSSIDNVKKSFANIATRSVLDIYDASSLKIEEGDAAVAAFTVDTNSVLTLNTIFDINVKANIIKSTKSKVELINIDTITSTDGKIFEATDSAFALNSIDKFSSKTPSEFTNSKVLLTNFSEFNSNEDIFKGCGLNITIIGNGDSSLTSKNGSILNTSSCNTSNRVIFEKIKNIISENSTAITIKNTSISLNYITKIESGASGYAIKAINSIITSKYCTQITGGGDDAILISNDSVLSIKNCDLLNLKSGATGNALNIDTGSDAYLNNVVTITGVASGIKLQNNSACTLNKIDELKGSEGDGIQIGRSCNLNCEEINLISGISGSGIKSIGEESAIYLKNIKKIEGLSSNGIELTSTDLYVDNYGINISDNPKIFGSSTGINAVNNKEKDSYTIKLNGPLTLDSNGSNSINASKYIIKLLGITLNNDFISTDSTLEDTHCNFKKKLNAGSTIINSTSSKIGDTINLSDESIYVNNKTTIGSDITLLDSLINLKLSTVSGDITLTNSSGLAELATLGSATINDSFLGAFATTLSDVTHSGIATYLGGATSGTDLSFSQDASISGTTAALTAEGGNLGLQAEQTLFIKSLDLDAEIRNNMDITTQAAININSDTTLDLTAATTITSTVGGSSITIATAQIDVTATLVNI